MKIQRNNYEKMTDKNLYYQSTGNRLVKKNQLRQGIPMSYNKFRLENSPDQTEFYADCIPDTG